MTTSYALVPEVTYTDANRTARRLWIGVGNLQVNVWLKRATV